MEEGVDIESLSQDDGGVDTVGIHEQALSPLPVTPSKGEVVLLGQGYDRVTSGFTGTRCLNGVSHTSYDNRESTVTLDSNVTQASLDQSFSMSASSKASFGLFDGSARASFAKQSRSDTRSLTFVYRAHLNLWRDYLTTDGVSIPSAVKAALGNTDWYSMCGDHFVTSIDRGGSLYIAVKLDFASASDKEAFSASIQARYGAVQADLNLSKAEASFKGRMNVSVYAYQEGGSSNSLAELIPDGKTGAHCVLGDFESCAAVLASALDYARGKTFKDGLATSPAAIAYYAVPYSAVKTVPNAPWAKSEVDLGPQVAAARDLLVQQMKNAAVIDNRIGALRQAKYFGATQPRQKELEALATQNLKNVAILQAVRPDCYEQISDGWGTLACVAHGSLDYLKEQGFVAIPESSMDVRLTLKKLNDRTDFFVARTPAPTADDNWLVPSAAEWSNYVTCPPKMFVTGFQVRAVPYQGSGDDTGLQGVVFRCTDPKSGATADRVIAPGWGNYTTSVFDSCDQGSLSGIAIRVHPSQGGGDDAGATDLKGICMTEQEVHPATILNWGNWQVDSEKKQVWTRCPAGTAVCGAAAFSEPYGGNNHDDTGLDNISIACCAY